MNKFVLITTFALILSLAFASSYDYYYPSHSSYGSAYESDYKKTVTHEEKETSTVHYPWGTEKITYQIKEKTTIVRDENKPYYQYNSPQRTYYYKPNKYSTTTRYTSPSSSNWRYSSPYGSNMGYVNTYTTPYYYEPRYDSDLGYYNWRY